MENSEIIKIEENNSEEQIKPQTNMVLSGKKAIQTLINDKSLNHLIKTVYLTKTQTYLINLCEQHKINYQVKEKNFFDTHYGDKAQFKYKYAIASIEKKPYLTLKELIDKSKDKSTLIMLDHLQDPFNFGAILRTCAASGIQGVIIPKDHQAPLNHNATLKASQGYALNVDVAVVPNLMQAVLTLKKHNYWIYATDINSESKIYNQIEYDKKSVLIMGTEGDGVSQTLKNVSDFHIYIPMKPGIDSLNVSVATGVILFEMQKNKI